MAKFRVIKSHDGIEAGKVKCLAPSSITAYMVANGYWEEITDKPARKNAKKKATTSND